MINVSEKYGNLDADTAMVFRHFEEPANSLVLEVGANEEFIGNILTDNGYRVLGIDLRQQVGVHFHNYIRIEDDFVTTVPYIHPNFDVAISTSAIEHFGLVVYGQQYLIHNYDIQAMDGIYTLLKKGGTCYITVPYGKEFLDEGDWRVYDRYSLQNRIIRLFDVEKKIFFLSGGCGCLDVDGIVKEEDADQYSGKPPHVTVFLKMRK